MPATITGFTLPQASDQYDPRTFQQLLDYIQALERAVYMKTQHVEIFSQADSGGREPFLILRSPDGTRWSITVDNAGVVTTTDIGNQGL